MGVSHEPWLVILSLIVAIQGAYVGLSLAVQVGGAVGLRRRLLLAGAAISLAVAIWAMHFVGMLAARLPFPVDYLVFPTLLSFLVCVLVVGAGVYAASGATLRPARLAAAAVFMGGGIAIMHYIGMSALHASAHMIHDAKFVDRQRRRGHCRLGAGAVAGGRARRTAAAVPVGDGARLRHCRHALHGDGWAHADAVPGGGRPGSAGAVDRPAGDRGGHRGVRGLRHFPADAGARPLPCCRRSSDFDDEPADEIAPAEAQNVGQGTYQPLGGLGSPPRRAAKQLPVEREGATHYVPVDEIVAVHANAHYTYLYDGQAKLFCPLAIGVVESRLDTDRFVRIHRSHIVNIDRITGLKRMGDTGLVDLGTLEPYTVPVSRGRLAWLRSRLGEKAGEPTDAASAA